MLTPEQECRTMPLSPQQRRRALLPSFLRRQEPNLANSDQNLTALDARLTKVDKGCQNLTPLTPAPTPNPSKTWRNRNHTHHPATPSVNLRCQPLQHTLNNPEQIRTNLNKPEHRRTPRPDREAARITPDHPEKKESRTPPPPTRSAPTRLVGSSGLLGRAGHWQVTWIPACAEMTKGGEGWRYGTGDRGASRSVRRLVASHPPPNLPPGRGEG